MAEMKSRIITRGGGTDFIGETSSLVDFLYSTPEL